MINKKNLIIIILLFLHYTILFAQNYSSTQSAKQQLILSQINIPEIEKTIDISVSSTPINEVLRGIGIANDINFDIESDLNTPITLNMTQVKIQDLLAHLIDQYSLDLKITGSIITIKKLNQKKTYTPKKINISYNTEHNTLSYELQQDSLHLVFKEITALSGKNLAFVPQLNTKLINGYIQNMPFEQAMENLAVSNNLNVSLSDKDYYLFEDNIDNSLNGSSTTQDTSNSSPRPIRKIGRSNFFYKILDQKSRLIEIDAQNTNIQDIIQIIANDLNLNLFNFSPLQGVADIKVKEIHFDNLIFKLLEDTSYTFYKEHNIYFFGEKKQSSQLQYEKLRLTHRSVEGLSKFIPQELSNKLQVKEDLELNAIIASGESYEIEKLHRFLNKIDVPIPVVFIEVMIADFQNGYSLKTGLTAGIGTQPAQTTGTLYPSFDMTFGAEKINKIIAGSSLLENIGPVGPNFFLQLQASEDNNKVRIHSTPNLSTLSGHKADMSIGQSTYYAKSNSNFYGTDNPVLNTNIDFEEIEAKLALEILPIVSDDNQITLNIKVERSNFTETANITIVDSQGRSVEVTPPPNKNIIEFNSMIRVGNEDVIVLGGLKDKNISNNGSGIPLISRIPIIGWLFSNKQKIKRDRKLVLFIKPTIL